MLDRIRRVLTPAAVRDEEQARIARLLTAIVAATLFFVLGMGLYYTLSDAKSAELPAIWAEVGAGMVAGAVTVFLVRRGWVTAATVVFAVALWLLFTLDAWFYGGVLSPEYARLALIPVYFGLLLGGNAAILGAVAGILTGLGLIYAASAGLLPAYDVLAYTPMDVWVTRIGDFFLLTVLLYLTDRTIRDALSRARSNQQALAVANRELEANQAALREQARDLERHSAYLEVLADVSRAMASTFDVDPLFWQVCELVQQRFGLYHVAFFLVRGDPGSELHPPAQWLEYAAGSGEAGRLLHGQGLRLELDGSSSASLCVASGQTRLVQDVWTEGLQTKPWMLPGARSEVALPLAVQGKAAGALIAQGDQTGMFDAEMLAALKNIADQVALAMDHARLFHEVEDRLKAEREEAGHASREEWRRMLAEAAVPGYRYANRQVAPLRSMGTAGQRAESEPAPGSSIAVPVRVRGETVGTVNLQRRPGAATWTSEEVAMLETLSDQLGVALDSARLYQETQRRAAQERLTAEVAAHVRETLDVDMVLQTALREISEALDLAEAVAWMGESE